PCWILEEMFNQRRHQWDGIRKLSVEKTIQRIFIRKLVKCVFANSTRVRQKQRTRKTAVEIRQRDHHELMARPDMERVWLDGEFRIACHGRYVELLVSVL